MKTSRVRPDASERMRSAFEAKAHTDWVREKVAESLADPRPHGSVRVHQWRAGLWEGSVTWDSSRLALLTLMPALAAAAS